MHLGLPNVNIQLEAFGGFFIGITYKQFIYNNNYKDLKINIEIFY